MRQLTRAVFAACAVVALGGCWFQPGADAERSGSAAFEQAITPDNVARLHIAWTRTLGGTVRAPAIGPDGVDAVSGDTVVGGALTVMDPDGGSTRWRAVLWDAAVPYLANPPTLLDGSVYVPLRGLSPILPSATRRYDAATGQTLAPTRYGNTESVTARDGRLVGTSAVRLPGGGTTAATSFFVESTTGTGTWSSYLYVGGDGSVPFPTSAAIGKDRFSIGQGSALEAYPLAKPSNCTTAYGIDFCPPVWSLPLTSSVAGHPVLSSDDTTVYAASGARLLVRHAADGTRAWTGDLGASASAAPAVAGGFVFVPTDADGLAVFAAAGCGASTCSPLWTATVSRTIASQPAVTGGGIVYVASGGTLTAFPAAGCGASTSASLWSVDTHSIITGGPVPALGKVFVGTIDGRLIAYGL